MGTRKCGCVVADYRNSSDVRKGIAMSGGMLHECEEHKKQRMDSYAKHLSKATPATIEQARREAFEEAAKMVDAESGRDDRSFRHLADAIRARGEAK